MFKLHKQSQQQIADKEIPPARYVNNSKFGPLYRLEKWMSPYLTDISRAYCKEEFLLDTDQLLTEINDCNEIIKNTPITKRAKYYLYTLDVAALSSIRPEEVTKAIFGFGGFSIGTEVNF